MDSLDLTFVRCPSCRSLVPAISTRCRMCGASLEASASQESLAGALEKSAEKSAEKSGEKSGDRGKDKAASNLGQASPGQAVAPGDALIAKSQSALSDSAERSADDERSGAIKFDEGMSSDLDSELDAEDDDTSSARSLKSALESDEALTEDPLSAYVEDLAAGGAESMSSDALSATTGEAARSGALQTGGTAKEMGPNIFAADAGALAVASNSRGDTGRGDTGRGDTGRGDTGRNESGSTRRNSSSQSDVSARSGAASAGTRQPFEARRNNSERRYQQPESQPSAPPGHGIQRDNSTNINNGNRRVEMKSGESRGGESRGLEAKSGGMIGTAGSAALARNPAAVSPAAISGAPRSRETPVFGSGRLVGWLVSYAEARGASLELREGKFFATAKSIKENDLVLDERSVSTPHALISCGRDAMVVQDLMSERGVFVRRQGSSQYRQEEEATQVDHGDWLRFGDLEFLVVLIPAALE